jgi:hypothetical protein
MHNAVRNRGLKNDDQAKTAVVFIIFTKIEGLSVLKTGHIDHPVVHEHTRDQQQKTSKLMEQMRITITRT